jgi:hypothetical protein
MNMLIKSLQHAKEVEILVPHIAVVRTIQYCTIVHWMKTFRVFT